MTTLPHTTRQAPNARTYEGRQRQTVHALKRELGYSDAEYRTMLRALAPSCYASDLNRFELARVIDVLTGFAIEKRRAERPVEVVSDDDALAVLA